MNTFSKVVLQVVKDTKLSKPSRLIFIVLLESILKEESVTVEYLAFMTGCSVRTVINVIQELESRNYISINKKSKPNKYELNVHQFQF